MRRLAKLKGGKCLSKIYIDAHTKLTWKCKEGHIWDANPNNIKTGKWCPFCYMGSLKGKKHSKETINKLSGKNNYNWHGGKMIQNGYRCILCPEHPKAKAKRGYVYEHVLVMEKHIGRHLKGGKTGECVHHIDGNKLNNNIKNLMLFKSGIEHRKFHRRK